METGEVAQDFDHIKRLLLKRNKKTPEKLRQLYSKRTKGPESCWTDFTYAIWNYFHGWITSLEIKTFDDLIYLMVTDQLKRRVPPEVQEHFLNEWTHVASSKELQQKLDNYEMVRQNLRKEPSSTANKWPCSKNQIISQNQ
ncbi:hypothetical protein HNY73_014029 [Argiope bruennichi]|uniref:Uncharacterized protein n=1 Tax=Argiope bruennichi TaxID=94029 RepID=A0A8T0ENS7_ARGBR|nr:hypothetical protein HNY73_014029 [Argiope bruennichi]